MSTPERRNKLTREEFFDYEDSIVGFAEFFDGQVFDMSGGTEMHSLIISSLLMLIGPKLKGTSCRGYSSDFQLEIEEARAITRPDYWVICGPTDLKKGKKDTGRNALLVVEVLSPSTSAFDRAGKFKLYRQVPTLREYVVVEQDAPHVDVFFLKDNGEWVLESHTDLDATVVFHSIQAQVPMRELYEHVIFE